MNRVIENKKALFNYEVIKKYTAGIKLLGEEVKSLRYQGGNLMISYVKEFDDGLYLVNFNIPKYKKSANINYNPKRARKLLLNKEEIVAVRVGLHDKGRTVVPLSVYLNKKIFKVDLALVKAKGKAGKKASLKEKQMELDLKRALKEAGFR